MDDYKKVNVYRQIGYIKTKDEQTAVHSLLGYVPPQAQAIKMHIANIRAN